MRTCMLPQKIIESSKQCNSSPSATWLRVGIYYSNRLGSILSCQRGYTDNVVSRYLGKLTNTMRVYESRPLSRVAEQKESSKESIN